MMTFNEQTSVGLPAEIWRRIIVFLRNAEPLPNLKESVRSDFRQDDLANCMRVSVNFNNIAAPLLYNRVITDCPWDLIIGLQSPAAHPAVPCKLDLLRQIKHLSIEYPELVRPPVYRRIMLGGELAEHTWEMMPPNGSKILARVTSFLDSFLYFANTVKRVACDTTITESGVHLMKEKQIVLRPDTFCYNSILTDYEYFWSGLMHHLTHHDTPELQQMIFEKVDEVMDIAAGLIYILKPKHSCQRSCDGEGPLSMPGILPPSGQSTENEGTIRSHQWHFNMITFAPDYHVEWVYEKPTRRPHPRHIFDLTPEYDGIVAPMKHHLDSLGGMTAVKTFLDKPFELDMYTRASYDQKDGVYSAHRDMAKTNKMYRRVIQREMQQLLPGVDFRFRLGMVTEAPACLACGKEASA